ncbi:hypothetical protein [Methanosphaera sp.]
MNKKIITILLIISILCTGLTSLAAQDNSSLSQSDDISVENDVSTQNTNETNDNQNTTINDTENQTNNNTTENITKRAEIGTLHDMITSLDTEQHNQLLNLMKEINEDDFEEFNKYLNSNNTTEEELYIVLNNLDDDEYYTLYIIVYNLKNNNSPSTITDEDIKNLPQRTQNAIARTSNAQLKQAVTNNNHNSIFGGNNHHTYKLTLADKYIILNDLIEGYLEKEITFDEFIKSLNRLGFDTSNLVLNSDGTISWNGITLPAPSSENKNVNTAENSTQTNTTNNTANNTESNQADTNNSEQATNDEVKTDTAEQPNTNEVVAVEDTN